ncbi:MAG: tetratricopeptide repeat protein [Acidobacteria bacterium]|nr:tetratricopeptide repeat protein [Acidobacteriota bacterium]
MNRQQFNSKMKKATSKEERISLSDTYAGELFEKEKYREAAEVFSGALKLTAEPNIKAYFMGRIGICHFNSGNDKEAFSYLTKSIQLFEPDKPEFMRDMYGFVSFHLGSLYEYHGKTVESIEARKVCEQYIESQEKETQWMLYAGLSRNYESLGRHDEAIRYSQKAIQVLSDNDPGLSYLYESMANNYMGLKQYNEAIKHFSKVLEIDPRFERRDEIHLKMADCYRRLSNFQMAHETYQKILELKQITGKKNELVWLYLKMAECQFRLGSFEKSLLNALEILRRNPRNKLEKAEARSYLTDNYYELGRYKEAVEEGEQTLKLARRFPNDDLFYVRMALSYHRLGNRRAFSKYRTLFRKLFNDENWNKYLEKLS